jgi:hypothetical protein
LIAWYWAVIIGFICLDLGVSLGIGLMLWVYSRLNEEDDGFLPDGTSIYELYPPDKVA